MLDLSSDYISSLSLIMYNFIKTCSIVVYQLSMPEKVKTKDEGDVDAESEQVFNSQTSEISSPQTIPSYDVPMQCLISQEETP